MAAKTAGVDRNEETTSQSTYVYVCVAFIDKNKQTCVKNNGLALLLYITRQVTMMTRKQELNSLVRSTDGLGRSSWNGTSPSLIGPFSSASFLDETSTNRITKLVGDFKFTGAWSSWTRYFDELTPVETARSVASGRLASVDGRWIIANEGLRRSTRHPRGPADDDRRTSSWTW